MMTMTTMTTTSLMSMTITTTKTITTTMNDLWILRLPQKTAVPLACKWPLNNLFFKKGTTLKSLNSSITQNPAVTFISSLRKKWEHLWPCHDNWILNSLFAQNLTTPPAASLAINSLFAQNVIVSSNAPLPLIFLPKNSLTILIISTIIPPPFPSLKLHPNHQQLAAPPAFPSPLNSLVGKKCQRLRPTTSKLIIS